MTAPPPTPLDAVSVVASLDDEMVALERRIGSAHVRQRLNMEADYEQRCRTVRRFFHLESWYSVHACIRAGLALCGLYGRARRNARQLSLVEQEWRLPNLPAVFDGYTLLHITDPHVDMAPEITQGLIDAVRPLAYDACVITGDFRTRTFGPYDAVLAAMSEVAQHLRAPIYAVLGNHDTLRLVPGLEAMGVRVLLNETVVLERAGDRLYLAGIDDGHYYRLDHIPDAARHVPPDAVAILLSHTPEVYARAAHAGFQLMLCGHTHGGQICLPGGFPVLTDADCPRRFARGRWRYEGLQGYTSTGSGSSIVDLRLNCPPEVTLHRLRVR